MRMFATRSFAYNNKNKKSADWEQCGNDLYKNDEFFSRTNFCSNLKKSISFLILN